jgi:hypothetical protein
MGHVSRNRSALVQDLAYSSPRYAQQLREPVPRQSRCRQNILAENLAGMRRSPLSIAQPKVPHDFKILTEPW